VITPNLASRPFLNNRPVWLLTIAAAVVGVVLIALNLRLYLVADRTLESETKTRDELQREVDQIEDRLRSDVAALQNVPWRSLKGRVEATNLILREHAFSWLVMLDDIERVMPYDVRITKISPSVGSDGVNLAIEIVGRHREALLELLDNLIADPRFGEPSPQSERTPDETASGLHSLSLRVLYLPPGEAS
jgi:Tfp pilus assembly protein PilN